MPVAFFFLRGGCPPVEARPAVELLLSEEPATIEKGRLLGEPGVIATGFLGVSFSPKRSSSSSVSVVDFAEGDEAEAEAERPLEEPGLALPPFVELEVDSLGVVEVTIFTLECGFWRSGGQVKRLLPN